MMVKKTKSNSLKKVATLALANLLLVGALTDNSAKAESKKDDTDLKLVSHNVYMLSTVLYPNWGQYKRADLIGQSSYIKNNDVVIFNEAFDNGASDKLLSNVKKEYPYQTPVLGRSQSGWDKTEGSYSSTVAEDGGVAIVSKYPIKEKIQHVFKSGCGFDNDSNKGFVYTKIEKMVRTFTLSVHIHNLKILVVVLDMIEKLELNKWKKSVTLLKRKNIPKDETVYIGGDLNVNKGTPEFKDMLKNLNVNDVLYAGHNSTWDPQSNSIAKYNYPNGKPEHLDYIFTDKDHKQPKQLVNEVVTEKPKPWDVYAFPYYYVYNDFSDHYPIKAYSK